MRLVEQGKLDLDVPVVRCMPGFTFSNAELGKRVTLRHVLSHTTGLPSGGKDFGPRDPNALRRFVWDELTRYEFIAEPGEVHLYSNTVIVLAGYLAEVVTGKYYEQLVQELIFDLLQMRRSTFDRTVAMTYPLALAHELGEDGTVRTKHRFTDNVGGNPAGFGISSTFDLANFAIMHLNEGRFGDTCLLSPKSIMEMHTPYANLYTPGAYSGYGLGLYTGTYKGVRQVLHGGLLESYNCFFTLFPDHKVGVILQCNYDDGSEIVDLVESIYDDLLDLPRGAVRPAAVVPDRALWSRHVGTYLSVYAGLASVSINGDQLVLERNNEATPLTAVEGGLYQAGGTLVGFVPEQGGPTQYIMIDSQPYRRFKHDPSFVPNPSAWTNYPGTYAAWEIDPDPLRVRVAEGELYLKWWSDEVVCTPLSDTSFVSTYGLIEFEVSEDGSVSVVVVGKGARHYRVEDGG
jgi:CubicO group peptidase (beta-lactamase class C family)